MHLGHAFLDGFLRTTKNKSTFNSILTRSNQGEKQKIWSKDTHLLCAFYLFSKVIQARHSQGLVCKIKAQGRMSWV